MSVTRITNDEEALQAAQKVAAGFALQADDRDRQRRLPYEEVERLTLSGLWGISVPKAYGGAGASPLTQARVTALLSAADASLGQIPQNHFFVLELLRVNGNEQQKSFFYNEVLKGARLGNALAEITTRNQSEQSTRLQSAGTNCAYDRINGSKFYATGSPFADWIPTSVVDDEGVVQLAFIKKGTEGLKIKDDWTGFGQRTTGSGTILYDKVEIPKEWVIPMQTAFDRPTPAGPLAQLLHAGIDLGIARGAYTKALDFIRDKARAPRDAGVESVTDDPLLLHRIGEFNLLLETADALLERAGKAVELAQLDTCEDTVAQASLAVARARIAADRAAITITNELFELTGSRSTLGEFNLDRYWRDARTHTLHDAIRWKYPIIGRFELNGERPPRHGKI